MNARRVWPVLAAAVVLAGAPGGASAQWTRAEAVPAVFLYALRATGDTLVVGADSVAWTSTDAGVTWQASAPVGTPPAYLDAVLVHRGRLWAGTGGQGVFTSDDLGASWQARGNGLAGGIAGSHLVVQDFLVRRDTMYAATGGAGVFARPLAEPAAWSPTGDELEQYQAGAIEQLAGDGARLLAVGGFNGLAFTNDGGLPWTMTLLGDSLLLPGLGVTCATHTGGAWLVGTDHGFYRSATGHSPWTFVGLHYAPAQGSVAVSAAGRTYVAVNRSSHARFLWTADAGAHWQPLEQLPTFVSDLAVVGTRLWAARSDGLWWRDVSTLAVTPEPVAPGLAFALAGAHPVTGPEARVRFRLAQPGRVTLELFDAGGRRVRTRSHELAAGAHELPLDVRGLGAGVHFARLTAAGTRATLRLALLAGAR